MSGIVFLHAHPDDEALLTAGTMALMHRLGHHVHIIVATDGARGLSEHTAELGYQRWQELLSSTAILGARPPHCLGYPDSGIHSEFSDGFATARVSQVAEEVLAYMQDVGVSTLVGYDANGGYGHPDHLHVHLVARAVAALNPQVRLAEVTVERERLVRALRWGTALGMFTTQQTAHLQQSYAPAAEVTDRIDVRSFAMEKRAAMRAHRSQVSGGEGRRTLDIITRFPMPLFRKVFGTEFYIDVTGSQRGAALTPLLVPAAGRPSPL